jgi:hypothetical protein
MGSLEHSTKIAETSHTDRCAVPQGTSDHWQSVYRNERPDELSWFTPHLSVSMALLKTGGVEA